MRQDLPALLCVIVAAVLGCRAMTEPAPSPLDRDTRHVTEWLDRYRDQPPMVRAFVQRMPKGGDLHNHLSGAVYAEAYVKWGAAANYSLDPASNALIPPSSHAPGMIRLRDVLEDSTAYSSSITCPPGTSRSPANPATTSSSRPSVSSDRSPGTTAPTWSPGSPAARLTSTSSTSS